MAVHFHIFSCYLLPRHLQGGVGIVTLTFPSPDISHTWWGQADGSNHPTLQKISAGQMSRTSLALRAGLEISENRHLPCITKLIGIHGENLIFSRNIKIFTCPAGRDTRKYERTSTIFEPCAGTIKKYLPCTIAQLFSGYPRRWGAVDTNDWCISRSQLIWTYTVFKTRYYRVYSIWLRSKCT